MTRLDKFINIGNYTVYNIYIMYSAHRWNCNTDNSKIKWSCHPFQPCWSNLPGFSLVRGLGSLLSFWGECRVFPWTCYVWSLKLWKQIFWMQWGSSCRKNDKITLNGIENNATIHLSWMCAGKSFYLSTQQQAETEIIVNLCCNYFYLLLFVKVKLKIHLEVTELLPSLIHNTISRSFSKICSELVFIAYY